jgi:guanylate kinase
LKDPREGSPFFPGEMAIRHPHLLYADLISPTISFNPPTPLADLLPPQLIISISGPSGMGKSSVQKELKKLFGKKASLAPTYTTRGKRVNEKQGIDIKTVTDAKFEKMRESGEFTAPNGTDLVFENYGGKKYARRVSDLTATPIVIIDQSFKALERMREAEIAPVFSVFLLLDRPREEWEKIIRSRKEPEKIVQQRIKSGRRMMREFKNHNFDLAVKNRKGKLKQTASKIHSEILTSQAKTNPPQAHVVIDGSPKEDKKLRAVFTFPDGRKKTTHFGGKHYSDYTIHKDKDRKKRYDTRHSKREDWEDFTTAGALSKWILWNKPSLKGSFDHYLALFSLTGELKVKTSLPGYIPAHRNPPMDCPPATQDLELNTKNRNSAIKTDYIRYGPLNLSDEKYYEDAAEHWNTDVATAKKSKCSNCVAFDISPRMLDCMPGPVSQDIEDEDGYLGYCWMHHFKCHSARTCFTWAAGGPIDEDDVSYEWQERSGIKTNPPSVTPEGRKIPKRYLKGLNKEEMIIAAKEIDKGYKYDIDDPKAYEFWKSDIKAQARGYKPVPSKYKKKFIEMYGPLPEKGDFLSKVSKATGVKKSILEEVMDRGLAAWRGGHAAATVQHQWATGRVYSFVTLGNTVMKDGRRMSDYKLAEEAGIIPDELKIPKKNPPKMAESGDWWWFGIHEGCKKPKEQKLFKWNSNPPVWYSKSNFEMNHEEGTFEQLKKTGMAQLPETSSYFQALERGKAPVLGRHTYSCTSCGEEVARAPVERKTRAKHGFEQKALDGFTAYHLQYVPSKKNPLQQTMSGKAIQMEKPATGRKVFYIPEEEDWYIVTVGYTSQKAAKDDMKEFEKIAKNHIEGDFKIVNKKKYNYAVRKGTKIPSGLNPRTGGPKLQQQAIQTRKSDEGETIFGGDPLLGESWKSNPPHQVQLNADGSTKAIANQIRREMQASGISVIQNAAMTPNSTYIELLPSEGQFDITVVAPSSSNKSLLLMDQVALFLSDDTGLDIATLNSDGKTALGNRLSFQSSSENGAIGILVNEELSTHDYYIKIAEAVTKAFRAKENPPEGTTVMTFNIRIPIKFEDTLDAFIKLEGRGYSWKNENFKNMWFTMHTPYGEKTSIHMQQSQTYLYNAHKMSEKEQEKVIEDLKAAGGVMKRKARSVSRDHLPETARNAINEKNKKVGRKTQIPPEIFDKLKEGDKEPFDEWLATQKPVPKEQQQQKPQQQKPQQQQQQQTRTSGPKQKVKQVESNLSKNLIKSLSGRKHPQTEKEKKASKKNQKKKKNPPTDGERCVCGCLIYISEWDGNMETGPPPIPGGYCRGFCKDIYTHEHREKYREHFGSGGGKKEYARSRFEQGDEVPFSWEDGYKPPQKSRGMKMQMEDGHVFKKYKTNPGLDNDAIYYLEDFGKAMTDAEAKRKFKSEKLRGPIGSEELFMQLAEKVQDFGEASGWIKDGRLYFRKGKKTVNEAMVTGYILEGATAFFHTHPRAWEPSQTSPDDFKVYHGLFTVRGIQDHFTVMGDRIDWFHFNKSDRIDSEEVARNIIDIESDIEEIFMETEGDFLDKTDGNAPLRDRTKAINDALNKQIPEYKAKFKNYQMSPVQISESKT